MAIFDSNIDYTKFIQFTEGTIQVASFVEIRDALVQRYKEIYGEDIDTSTASADGQFINSIALIINNICQTFSIAFDQLDPSVATGKYLDILCSYNNIQRINQSASKTELYIYNPTDMDMNNVQFLMFIDRNGLIWKWTNGDLGDGTYETKFPKKQYTIITDVTCESLGAIEAKGCKFIDKNYPDDLHYTDNPADNNWDLECPGDVYKFVNVSSLRVWQYQDAIVGNEEESDTSLRERRYMMLGNQSISVLEGLKGSLFNLSGIEDVYIFNNPTINTNYEILARYTYDEDFTTKVPPHSVMVALRYKPGVNVEESLIGNLIYNKMTPGIGTIPASNDDYFYLLDTPNNDEYVWDQDNFEWSQETHSGDELNLGAIDHEPTLEDLPDFYKYYTIKRTNNISYNIYWLKCQAIDPQINVNLKCFDNFDFLTDGSGNISTTVHSATTDFEKRVVQRLREYLRNIPIDGYAQASNIMNVVQQCDSPKQGNFTFITQSADIDSLSTFEMKLSYFDYVNNDFEFQYVYSSNEWHLIIRIAA